MPKINVYLSDELADAVKQANLPISTICQRALEHAVRRVTAIHESLDVEDPTGQFNRFTNRARTVVALAVDDARADNRPVGTGHLLTALLDEGAGMALRILASMEIEPQELAAAVTARRADAPAPADSETGYGAGAREALRLAVTESIGLGHNFVGTEHLLLGLIAEPDDTAGQLLRAAGADLRLTRRAVAAAMVGWVAHSEIPTPPAGGDVVAALSAAVHDQLAPVLARLDRLEQRLDR